jgi:hypothetical protein
MVFLPKFSLSLWRLAQPTQRQAQVRVLLLPHLLRLLPPEVDLEDPSPLGVEVLRPLRPTTKSTTPPCPLGLPSDDACRPTPLLNPHPPPSRILLPTPTLSRPPPPPCPSPAHSHTRIRILDTRLAITTTATPIHTPSPRRTPTAITASPRAMATTSGPRLISHSALTTRTGPSTTVLR